MAKKDELKADNFQLREKQNIQHVLNTNYHSISVSADILGISRSTLYRKMKKYGIS